MAGVDLHRRVHDSGGERYEVDGSPRYERCETAKRAAARLECGFCLSHRGASRKKFCSRTCEEAGASLSTTDEADLEALRSQVANASALPGGTAELQRRWAGMNASEEGQLCGATGLPMVDVITISREPPRTAVRAPECVS